MPVYEYYCRSCQSKFERLRPIKTSELTTICPSGHEGATRTITMFATIGAGMNEDALPMAGGGGCACGGACACGGH